MSPQFLKLEEIAETSSGGTPSRGNKAFYGGAIPWIKSGELPDGEITEVEESITQLGLEGSSAKLLPAGTLVIAMYGATVGKLGILTFPAATNQAVCAIVPCEELHRDYLFYWLLAIRETLVDKSFGGAQPNISQTVIRDIDVPWINTDEQKRVAGNIRAQLAEVEKARQAAVWQLQDVALLPTRILNEVFNDITGDTGTLNEVLVDIQAGKSFQTAETLAGPEELGVLKVSAVTWIEFRPSEAKALRDAYDPAESHRVKNRDFIISRANTKEFVGAVVLVDRDYPNRLLSDKTLRLVVDERRVCKEYLLYAMRASMARRHIEHFATGTSDSMRNISHGTITSIPLHLPELNEQRLLAAQLQARLKHVTEVRSAIEAQLREIEQLPNRILTQAFES